MTTAGPTGGDCLSMVGGSSLVPALTGEHPAVPPTGQRTGRSRGRTTQGVVVPRKVTPENAAKPRIITYQSPATGLESVQVSLLPLRNGLQVKVLVVGFAADRTYRSASPVPPLMVNVTDVLPAATASFQNCCEPEAPLMLVTGTPLTSEVVALVRPVKVTPEKAANPRSIT